MAGEITLHQALSIPVINRVISQVKTPLDAFQRRLGQTVGSEGATERVDRDAVSWDIFNVTRTMAKLRPRTAGPSRTSEKPFGMNSATLVRLHDSLHLLQDKIFKTRDLGQGFDSPVDVTGQAYIARQLSFLKRRFSNSREFMLSRMFRNGFGVKFTNEDMSLVESDDADAAFTVDYKIPASNLGGSAFTMGGSSPIIDIPWDDPSANIPDHLYAINRNMMRLNGYELTEYWMNSATFTKIQQNNYLASIAGSSNTVFTSIGKDETLKGDDANAQTGYSVRFRALPLHVFHIYDGVLSTSESSPDSTTEANTSMFLPTGKVLGHPMPSSDWVGYAAGSEIVAESYVDPGKHVQGFHVWKNRTILPPGWDLIAVDNYLPILYVPSTVVYFTAYTP